MSAVVRSRASDARQYTSWDRARLSVVVPIGVIVAVAIVCIVVAVLSSAQRADVVAVDHEKQMKPAEAGNRVFGNPVAKMRKVGIAAQVAEGQHSDRRAIGQ